MAKLVNNFKVHSLSRKRLRRKDIIAYDEVSFVKKYAKSYPLLTAEQETELASRIAQGDQAANDQLVLSNLRLVPLAALKYHGHMMPVAELMSDGFVGLVCAAKEWRPDGGARFATYAMIHIKKCMLEGAERHRLVRLPRRQFWRMMKYRSTLIAMSNNLDREVAVSEVLDTMQLPPVSMACMRDALCSQYIAQEPESTRPGSRRHHAGKYWDTVSCKAATTSHGCAAEVREALNCLDDCEAQVIKLLYGLDVPEQTRPRKVAKQQVAKRLGISAYQVGLVQRQALQKLASTLVQNDSGLVPTWF